MFLPLGSEGMRALINPSWITEDQIITLFSQNIRLWENTMFLRKTRCVDIQVCKTRCFQKGMKILQVLEAHGIYKLTSCMYHFATSNLVLASWNSMLRWRQRQQSEFEPPSGETLEVCTILFVSFCPCGPRMAKHNVNAWLINTGWTGGAFGAGHRMSLKDLASRAVSHRDASVHEWSHERKWTPMTWPMAKRLELSNVPFLQCVGHTGHHWCDSLWRFGKSRVWELPKAIVHAQVVARSR